MTKEENIFVNLDSEALKTRGINAIEALVEQLKAKDKYIKELENALVDKEDGDIYWSPSGLMTAKQVSKYLGYKYSRIVELGNSGVLKMKREGKSLIFFKDNILKYKQDLESDIKTKFKVI